LKKLKPPKHPSSTVGLLRTFLERALAFYWEWTNGGDKVALKKIAVSSYDDVGYSTHSETVSDLSCIGEVYPRVAEDSLDLITFRNSSEVSEKTPRRPDLRRSDLEKRLSEFLKKKISGLQVSLDCSSVVKLEVNAIEKRMEWTEEFLESLDADIDNEVAFVTMQAWLETMTEERQYSEIVKSIIYKTEVSAETQLRRSMELLEREKARLARIMAKVSDL
jgi:hypothetical protein